MAEDISSVTDDSFEDEVLKSEDPVLVDFWAGWCVPCKRIVPTLEYLVQNYKDKIKVVKLDVDENMKTPSKYGVMSIPTLLYFKDGVLVEKTLGALPKKAIETRLAKLA